MPLHLEQFQREAFQGYVENVPPKREYALAKFMPNQPVYDIEFTYNIINGGYGQMASITAWDSGAPLRDKDVIQRLTAQIAKIQHAYRLTEKELLMFHRPRMDEEQQQVIQAIYNNTDKLVWGVQDREEWLRAKAVYEGRLQYSENNVQLNIDFLIPAENKLTADVRWSNPSAPVIQHLQSAVQRFKKANNGEKPVEMHMSGRVETWLLQNEQVKAHIYGNTTDPRIVTSEQLQQLFSALSLPPYRVIDEQVIGENGAEALMPEDRVVLLGEELGHTMEGPTVENNYKPGIYVIPEIKETNPPRQEVYVGKSVFPALERPQAVVHLIVA